MQTEHARRLALVALRKREGLLEYLALDVPQRATVRHLDARELRLFRVAVVGERQVGRHDQATLGDDGRTLHDVAQLADVAFPVVRLEHGARLV